MNITIIGDLDTLPENIQKTFKKFNSKYDKNKTFNLYLAVAYDFEKDILNYGLKNNKNYIREQPNLDIILRTGGEFRISGFFPCHNNYAEIFILDKYCIRILISKILKRLLMIFYIKRKKIWKMIIDFLKLI